PVSTHPPATTPPSVSLLYLLSLHASAPPPHLHSFPTRRSSDLLLAKARSSGTPVVYLQHESDEFEPLKRGTATWQIHPEIVPAEDRKSTRLNSSHVSISYAVFCLKKKKKK